MKNNKSISFLIPCLNEAGTILRVIDKANKAAKKYGITNFEILVADNGSTDKSIELIKSYQKARLVRVPVRGYGAALHWGIIAAKGDYVFFADADLSYDFMEIRKFLKFAEGHYDLILGSRYKGRIFEGAMPYLNRYFGTPLLIRIMYGIKTTDCNSGMRLIKKDFYMKLHMRNSGMEWASELILKTALIGGEYAEVPINFYRDRRGSVPHLARWTDGWRHLKAILLIKPNFLFLPTIILLLLALLVFNSSLSISLLFVQLSFALFLSTLAAKLLNFAIDNRKSTMVVFVMRLPLVLLGGAITFLAAFIIVLGIFQPEIELFIVGEAAIFDIWVFLIETIKTHLVNTLPEKA